MHGEKKIHNVDTSKSIKCGKTKNTKKKWNVQVLQKIISFCKVNTDNLFTSGSGECKKEGKRMGLGVGIKIFQIPKSRFIEIENDENWKWFPAQ